MNPNNNPQQSAWKRILGNNSLYDRVRGIRNLYGENAPVGTPGGFNYARPQVIPTSVANSNQPGSMTQHVIPPPTPQPASSTTGAASQQNPTPTSISPLPPMNPSIASSTTPDAQLTYPSAIRGELAMGAPSSYQTREQSLFNEQAALRNKYAPLVASPFGQPGIGQGPQRMSDYELARYNALNTGIQNELTGVQTGLNRGLSAAQGARGALEPMQVSPGTGVISPVTGQSLPGYSASESALRGGAAGYIQNATPEYFSAIGNRQGIKNVEGQLTGLIGEQGLNPSSIPRLNSFINTVMREGASNPNYQLLNGLVNDITARYSNYLSAGGTTTDTVRNAANELINGHMTGEAITTVLQGLGTAMDNVISGQGSAIGAAQGTLGGTGLPYVGASTGQNSGGNMFGSFF